MEAGFALVLQLLRPGSHDDVAGLAGLVQAQAPAGGQGRGGRGGGQAQAPQSVTPENIVNAKPIWEKLYPGWKNQRIKTSGAEINAVIGG